MKNKQIFSPFTWLLLGSVALAQAGIADAPDGPKPQDPDMAKIETAKIEPTVVSKAEASHEGELISQARHYPRPSRARMRPPGQAYRSRSPMPGLSPWGALIGFGAGVALGASGSRDTTSGGRVVGSLLFGGIGAVVGGVIGTTPPFWHTRRAYPRYGPGDDDDDSDLRSDGKALDSKRVATKKPAATSQSTAVESVALASQEELAAP